MQALTFGRIGLMVDGATSSFEMSQTPLHG